MVGTAVDEIPKVANRRLPMTEGFYGSARAELTYPSTLGTRPFDLIRSCDCARCTAFPAAMEGTK